jgi:hypothetical protein
MKDESGYPRLASGTILIRLRTAFFQQSISIADLKQLRIFIRERREMWKIRVQPF